MALERLMDNEAKETIAFIGISLLLLALGGVVLWVVLWATFEGGKERGSAERDAAWCSLRICGDKRPAIMVSGKCSCVSPAP